MKLEAAEEILETYTLVEILEWNNLTEADVLVFLIKEDLVELPEPMPLHFDD